MDKKQVYSLWNDKLDGFSRFKPGRFYCVYGPLIVGIELVPIPGGGAYRPYWNVYPLWDRLYGVGKQDPFLAPNMMLSVLDSGILPMINYSDPEESHLYWIDLSLRQQIVCRKDRNNFSSFYADVQTYMGNPLNNNAHNPGSRAVINEMTAAVAAYCNETRQVEEISKMMLDKLPGWKAERLNSYIKNPEAWIDSIRAMANRRELFMNEITLNSEIDKLRKLPRKEFIIRSS